MTPRSASSNYMIRGEKAQMPLVEFMFSSAQSCDDSVFAETWGTIQQISPSSLFYRKPLLAVLAWAGLSTLWRCPTGTKFSFADHGVAQPSKCPEERFCRDLHCVYCVYVPCIYSNAVTVTVNDSGLFCCVPCYMCDVWRALLTFSVPWFQREKTARS